MIGSEPAYFTVLVLNDAMIRVLCASGISFCHDEVATVLAKVRSTSRKCEHSSRGMMTRADYNDLISCDTLISRDNSFRLFIYPSRRNAGKDLSPDSS